MDKKSNAVYTSASVVTLETTHNLSSYLLEKIFYPN